jgi:retron-type reverse transcriptase
MRIPILSALGRRLGRKPPADQPPAATPPTTPAPPPAAEAPALESAPEPERALPRATAPLPAMPRVTAPIPRAADDAPQRAPADTAPLPPPAVMPATAPAAAAAPEADAEPDAPLPARSPHDTNPLPTVPVTAAGAVARAEEAEEDADEDDEDDEEADEDEDDEEEEDEVEPRPRYLAGDRVTFGEEQWGIGAAHRAAALDDSKLTHFDLPRLASEAELAEWLGIPLPRLRWYTHDRAADTTWHYVRYTIPKRSGGERVILAPKRELKRLQRKVLDDLLARVPVAPAAHGFVRGRSILTNARPHAERAAVLRLDLKDFFPSITAPRVRGLFIALGYPFSVAAALALLCTEYEREPFERDGTRHYVSVGPRHLVQGAPTSPALANLAAWRLDRRLAGLAGRHGVTYTRYADDLTFSSDDPEAIRAVRVVAKRIIAEEHFALNTAKTHLAERSARQVVTGLVVNDGAAAPRELRRRLRAILHNAHRTGLAAQNRDGRAAWAAYLRGQIAFVESANPQHAERLRAELRRALASDAAPGGAAEP